MENKIPHNLSRLPDFLVIGAQKSGTTTLFSLLKKHPKIYLPPQKEVQFFSNDSLYERGLSWYCKENFSNADKDKIAGEISPQYMLYKKVPHRIKLNIPEVKLIAILRHPVRRAYSHYQMSVRRGHENRSFSQALMASNEALADENIVGHIAYYQYSNYSEILSEYLSVFPKDRFLIVFQEDLDKYPELVLKKIYKFLGIDEVIPENPNVRLHQSGEIKYKWLNRLLKGESILKTTVKTFLPWRFRAALRFWLEQVNIRKTTDAILKEDIIEKYQWLTDTQKKFIENEFSVKVPW